MGDCICGLTYDEFRTGWDFAEARRQMFVNSDDPKTWRQKRRHSVLGFWREVKRTMFAFHVQCCKHYAREDDGT